MEAQPALAERIFAAFYANTEDRVLALHADGRVEQTRHMTDAEKLIMFDQIVAEWPTLATWLATDLQNKPEST